MLKKIWLSILCVCLQVSVSYAAVHIKVASTEDFRTDKPSKELNVKVLEQVELGEYNIKENSTLHCQVLEVVDPKRGKRNATFYVRPLSYTKNDEITCIKEDYYGRYSKTVLSKEELKKIPPGKVVKNAALSVGNHFVKGISLGYYFLEGVVDNEGKNRFKSGTERAYKSSPLSFIGEGEQLDIKVGDDFYFVFKIDEEE